ncbi:MAG: choice-of-anchor Q domain-containing protein, partial [Candidatus Binatia bacterium]
LELFFMHRLLVVVVFVASMTCIAANPAGAMTFATDSTLDQADVAPGDGVCASKDEHCTLRAALAEANALAGADAITLLAASYALDPLRGPLAITDDVEIVGESAMASSIETMDSTRQEPIRITSATVTVSALSIIGSISADNGLIDNAGTLTIADAYIAGSNFRGLPGIRNRAVLLIEDSTIEGHFSDFGGIAAIANEGSLTVLRSLVRGTAGREGGVLIANVGDTFVSDSVVTTFSGTGFANLGTLKAVHTEFEGFANDFECQRILGGSLANHGEMTLTECSVAGIARCGGGALANFGVATVVTSTLGGSSDDSGGAIANEGVLVLRNSTVSASSTNGQVGAIDNRGDGSLELHGCTITDNAGAGFAGSVGGIRGNFIAMAHTILAGNHGDSADCAGKVLSLGHNLIGDPTGCTFIGDTSSDVLGVDAKLGPLADNGGATFTHALLPGSPARDAGFPTGGPGNEPCETTDQRGVVRPQGTACDIGAVEALLCGDGKIEAGEECDDGNSADGDCCSSTCTLAPDDSPCNDGNACTLADTCHAGTCSSTAARVCGACTTCDVDRGCVAKVRASCRQPTRRVSGHIDLTTKRTSKLTWKWTEGEGTAREAFHDPTAGGTFALCVFDEAGSAPRVAFATETRTGHCGKRACWRNTSASTFTYKDPDPAPNGLSTVVLKSGNDGKAKILVDAKGPALTLPTLPLALPLRVQLQAADGSCWEARYVRETTTKNTPQQLSAKAFHP